MQVSDDVLRVWMTQVRRYLHRYWDHPHYDDIVAEAYMAMWEAISRSEGVTNLEGYAMRAAWNGAQSFLGGPHNQHRTWDIFHQRPVEPPLYLADCDTEEQRRSVPDFAPALIEWLAACEEWERERERNPIRAVALALCTLGGLSRNEARAQLGLPRWRIDRLLRGVPRSAIPYEHPYGGRFTSGRGRER